MVGNRGGPAERKRGGIVRPDEVFEAGPIRIARYGRFLKWENRATEAEHAAHMERLAEAYPEICTEIDDLVCQIAEMVSGFDPLQLLHRAYWNFLTENMGVASEVNLKTEAIETRFILEYLQSMICAVQPKTQVKHTASEEEWSLLTGHISSLFHKIQHGYFISHTAWAMKHDPHYDSKTEEYSVPAQMHWMAVRGTRYLVHDLPHFNDLLSPHDDVFRALFGIGIEEFLQGLAKIFNAFTHGPMEAMEELDRFKDVTLTALEEKLAINTMESDPVILMDKIIQEHGWESWRDKVLQNAIGLGLFDLDSLTGLPAILLDALAWMPGQDKEFLANGSYRGWPLRVLPIWKRPFLKVGDRHYCFSIYALTDHLYRIMQRAILQLEPKYRETWNRRQQSVSEYLPVNLLTHILLGAEVYQSVHYPCVVGDNQHQQWCETDGLLLYDDHLIVVEVKGGSFTHTPPSTDFPAYIRSLDQLLRSPAQQAARFCSYLDSAPEITIYDKEHQPIRQLRRSDYRHITRCCVTLDQLTEFAARAEAMKEIGVDVGAQPVWNISIDDLRVFVDIFNNPLVFCHFLEERARAYSATEFESNDELDHLGLYLAHNHYTTHARELAAITGSPVRWHGYREKIDQYYSSRLKSDTEVQPPCQEAPKQFNEIIDVLARHRKPGCCKAASWLLDMSGEFRSLLTQMIDRVLSEGLSTGGARPATTFGELPTSVYCWIAGEILPDPELVRFHTLATLLRANEQERLALELFLESDGRVDDVRFTFFKPTDVQPYERPKIDLYMQEMVARRFKRALSEREKKKIGRNERCPCGSGKKYKKCCINA